MALDDWLKHGIRLGIVGRGAAWWIGDWLRYGNANYGEKYSRATQVTGYNAKSLRNMVYVADRFEPARRRARLSWSHHAALASLSADEQELWLEIAGHERLSVQSLRLELARSRRRDAAAAEPPGGEPVASDPVVDEDAPCDDDAARDEDPARDEHDVHDDPKLAICCPECGCEFRPQESRDMALAQLT